MILESKSLQGPPSRSPRKIAGSKSKVRSAIDTINLKWAEHSIGEFQATFEDEGFKSGPEMQTVVEVLQIDKL